MKLGLSTPLAHESAEEWAKQMNDLGCGAVVFPLDYTADDNAIADYVAAAEKYGLTIAEVGIWRNVFAIDTEERERARAFAQGQLRLADEIGARCCVNIAGTYGGPVWDGGYRSNYTKEYRAEVIAYTQQLLDDIRPTRTECSLEPMPWMVPTGPDDYLALMREIDRDAFGIHLDIINMINCPERYFFMDEFMDECFAKLGPYIRSCHLKDIKKSDKLTFRLEEVPLGQGILNLEKYVENIDACDRNMPLIIEHLDTDREYLDSLHYVQRRLQATDQK